MQDNTKNSLKKAFSIITAVWSVVVGILFIVQVWRIFAGGTNPYTPQNISEKFSQIAIPVYIGLVLIILSLVLSLLLPDIKEKIKPFALSDSAIVKRLQRRIPIQNAVEEENLQAVYAWKVKNVLSWCVCSLLIAVCLIVAFAYLLGGFAPVAKQGFFAEHSSAEFILRGLPWLLSAFGAGVFAVYFNTFTQNKQIALMKTLLANAVKRGEKPSLNVAPKENLFAFTQSVWFLPVVRGVVGAVAITLIIVGICTGGMGDVLANAITICTQCIGLG